MVSQWNSSGIFTHVCVCLCVCLCVLVRLVGWVFGCLVVWLFRSFGCSVLRLFLRLVVWLFGCSVVRMLDVRLCGCVVVRLFSCSVVWLFGCFCRLLHTRNSTARADRKTNMALLPLLPFFVRDWCRSLPQTQSSSDVALSRTPWYGEHRCMRFSATVWARCSVQRALHVSRTI